jgi:PAS domain S-box-containing protein
LSGNSKGIFRSLLGQASTCCLTEKKTREVLIVETLTIAIIDDEEAHFSLMKRAILQEYPYASVHHFLEVSTCLEKLDEIIPNVILTDYLMPGMNGIELLEILNQQNMDFPVIMITGQGDENIAARAMKLGAKDYLVKTGEFFSLLPSVIEKVFSKEKLKQSLRESEKKYRLLVDNASLGIVVSQDGVLKFVNPETSRLSGYTEAELTSRPFVDFVHPDDRTTIMEHHVNRVKGDEVPGTYMFRIITKDGNTLWLENKGVLVSWEGHPGTLNFLSDLTGLKIAMEHIRSLSQTMMQAQERERQMISYELHDRIAQNLSSLKMGCDLLFDGQSDIPPEIIEKKIKLSKEIEKIIISVRDLSYDLRPPGIDEMGLVTAIEIYCEEFSEKSGLKVEFQSAGMHQFDSGYEVGIHIYRLIQEGLNNIQKHANADRVTIKLVRASPNIILRIEDNGKGFNVRERELSLGKEKRMGLRSMKERVNLLGGEITIQSRLKKGTKIFIKLPLKEKSSDLEKTRNHR